MIEVSAAAIFDGAKDHEWRPMLINPESLASVMQAEDDQFSQIQFTNGNFSLVKMPYAEFSTALADGGHL